MSPIIGAGYPGLDPGSNGALTKMIKAINKISIIILLVATFACSPTRHQMPITTSSEEARELFLRGRELSENGLGVRADTLIKQAIALDPDFALAHLFISSQIGVPKAKELINKVSLGEALMIRATEAYYSGDFIVSDLTTDSLIDMFPRDKNCLLFASINFYNRDITKTIEYLNRASEIDPYYAAPYNLLGYQMIDLNRFDEAKAAFLKYLDIYPNSGNILDSFAEMLLKMGH